MFPLFGGKKKLAAEYPVPVHPVIIEPFAGSAAYSLHADNWQRDVILVERDARLAALWRWLITEATPDAIHALPDPVLGQRTSHLLHILSTASRWSLWYRSLAATAVMVQNWKHAKGRMAADVLKVKHWKLIEGDYTLAPSVTATWYVDAPYAHLGSPGTGGGYRHRPACYSALSQWIDRRRGQVVVCERVGADWIDGLVPLSRQYGIGGRVSHEAVRITRQ